MKWLARYLRRWAEMLDPQPSVIELVQIGPSDAKALDMERRGFPFCFWRWAPNSFAIWPMPTGELRLRYRLTADL